MEFPRAIKSKSCGMSWRSWFLVLEYPRGVTQFSRISRDEALFCVFCLEFAGVKYQTEIPGISQVCSQPPATFLFFFLGIAGTQLVINQEFWSFRFRVIQVFGMIIFLSFFLDV